MALNVTATNPDRIANCQFVCDVLNARVETVNPIYIPVAGTEQRPANRKYLIDMIDKANHNSQRYNANATAGTYDQRVVNCGTVAQYINQYVQHSQYTVYFVTAGTYFGSNWATRTANTVAQVVFDVIGTTRTIYWNNWGPTGEIVNSSSTLYINNGTPTCADIYLNRASKPNFYDYSEDGAIRQGLAQFLINTGWSTTTAQNQSKTLRLRVTGPSTQSGWGGWGQFRQDFLVYFQPWVGQTSGTLTNLNANPLEQNYGSVQNITGWAYEPTYQTYRTIRGEWQ